MTKDDFYNEATSIICFDPSMNYTGWLHYRPAHNKIERYGCIRKDEILPNKDYDGIMEKRMAFAKAFSWKLRKLLIPLDPKFTYVVSEHPHGSQSSAAVWAMALSTQAIVTSSVAILNNTPVLYPEREAKMHMFNTRTVEKSKTMKYMWSYWLAQGITPPEEHWKNEHRKAEMRKMKEAVADAMLILNLHLHKLSETLSS